MLDKISSLSFDWQRWRAGCIIELIPECREKCIVDNADILRKYAVGYCNGLSLVCRPKENTMGVMFYFNGEYFWTHLTVDEFNAVFK